MKLLLDTCTFLWLALDDPALSDPAKEAFKNPHNEIFLSVVSAWEIAVKHALGDLPLPGDPAIWITTARSARNIQSLPLEEEAVSYVGKLPLIHRDPFDRMLICQSIVHELTLLTPDKQISQYPIRTLW
jgi:PIN domain nuclease of toxin-antitoxin system